MYVSYGDGAAVFITVTMFQLSFQGDGDNFHVFMWVDTEALGFPILNGVIMLQNIGRHLVGMVYHPIWVHVVEVVLAVSYTHLDVYKRQVLSLTCPRHPRDLGNH